MMSLNSCRLLHQRLRNIVSSRNDIFLFASRFSSKTKNVKNPIPDGPGLKDFIVSSAAVTSKGLDLAADPPPYIDQSFIRGWNRKVYFDVHGCQMNVNDTEIVWAILESAGFSKTDDITVADVILMMTCAIRDNAEKKIWNKLQNYKHMKLKGNEREQHIKIGILGCMAERLKDRLIEKEQCIDLVCGPDSYKDLPRLLALTDSDQKAVNVLLSLEETYADIVPVRLNQDSVTAFVSIMRGCDNMCSYCIVPFTRGRERSRPIDSILHEVQTLADQGIKEITLLGQNVNSYRDTSTEGGRNGEETSLAPGFSTVYKSKKGGLRFAHLLDRVASAAPNVRIRFTSPHPKDFPMQVLEAMAEHDNICNSIHLPAQSGSDSVLERMRRGYTRSAYMDLVRNIRSVLPNVALSSDFICGFCSETEEDFEKTLELIDEVKYNVAYLFAYSMREKTTAHRRYKDDVPENVKQERLVRMIKQFRLGAEIANKAFENTVQTILVEGVSKRSSEYLQGRTDGNIKVIIPSATIPEHEGSNEMCKVQKGDYVSVKITESNSQVLKGVPLHLTSLNECNRSPSLDKLESSL